ncbi:hypothetical protein Ancab_020931 [Ancistrocladus abbreviatus]
MEFVLLYVFDGWRIGVPHVREGGLLPHGGRNGWVAPPDPQMGHGMRFLKKIAEAHNLTPEFEITMEATHHGPSTSKPIMFLEIGKFPTLVFRYNVGWSPEKEKDNVRVAIRSLVDSLPMDDPGQAKIDPEKYC